MAAPLKAIISNWMKEALSAEDLSTTLEKKRSPLNVLCTDPFSSNIESFRDVFKRHQVDGTIYYARKANRCREFVTKAISKNVLIDVAHMFELDDCLSAGIPGESLLCTAPFKSSKMLQKCLSEGVEIVIDSLEEGDALAAAVKVENNFRAKLRLSGFQFEDRKLVSRFGVDCSYLPEVFEKFQSGKWPKNLIRGFHFHLDGYSVTERALAISKCLELKAELSKLDVIIDSIDIGGGFLVNYLEDSESWLEFQNNLQKNSGSKKSPFYPGTIWAEDSLRESSELDRRLYPYSNSLPKGEFLDAILSHQCTGGDMIATRLKKEQVRLCIEPGRALLDQCGMTLTRVLGKKFDSEGRLLVGLDMNNQQLKCPRTEYCLDPILVSSSNDTPNSDSVECNLVGNLCMEQDFILKRQITLPKTPSVGDILAFPNAAGYFMHLFDTPGHSGKLASNIFFSSGIFFN